MASRRNGTDSICTGGDRNGHWEESAAMKLALLEHLVCPNCQAPSLI